MPFSKNSEVENQTIRLEITSGGITKVLITDLAPGNWSIPCIDNKKQSIGMVKSSNNLFYFNASKGTYVITIKSYCIIQKSLNHTKLNIYPKNFQEILFTIFKINNMKPL